MNDQCNNSNLFRAWTNNKLSNDDVLQLNEEELLLSVMKHQELQENNIIDKNWELKYNEVIKNNDNGDIINRQYKLDNNSYLEQNYYNKFNGELISLFIIHNKDIIIYSILFFILTNTYVINNLSILF